jgi:hypothetical protein
MLAFSVWWKNNGCWASGWLGTEQAVLKINISSAAHTRSGAVAIFVLILFAEFAVRGKKTTKGCMCDVCALINEFQINIAFYQKVVPGADVLRWVDDAQLKLLLIKIARLFYLKNILPMCSLIWNNVFWQRGKGSINKITCLIHYQICSNCGTRLV